MKKIISSLLMIVILFNFILCNKSYADSFEGTSSITSETEGLSGASQEALVNEGSTSQGNIGWGTLGAIFGTIAGILATVINLFPMLVQVIMQTVAGEEQFFTIERAVFNQIALFNVNYFDFDASYTIGMTHQETINPTENVANTVISIRESVAQFFVIMRLIAMAISLLVLIYVGIRMALSTISSDKAKYKEMLIGWVESILLLFLMQYIITIIVNIGQMFGNIIYDIKYTLDANGEMSFEADIIDNIYSFMLGNSGWTYVLYSVVYWFLIGIQIKFYFSYFRRIIVVGFLILIAPLISVTYPIDKVGDGKAQAFSVWFNELAMNIFIQPIHALIYLVFMYTAGEIAKISILVALVFLLSLTKVEKIVLYLFNLKNVTSLKPVADEKTKI